MKLRLKYWVSFLTVIGKKIDPKKITAITQFPKIDTLKKCQSFLGMCAFIANFVPHFATVAAPIFNLLKDQKLKPFVMTKEASEAIEKIKEFLTLLFSH